MKKYLVFIDESGDPNVEKIDPQYPVFGVGALIFEEQYFTESVLLNFANLKIRHGFSVDTVFHSSEIRKQKGDFVRLVNYEKRINLLADISSFFKSSDLDIISSVIKKTELKEQYNAPGCPYDLSFQFILERLAHFLHQKKSITEITLERRVENVVPLQNVFNNLKTYGNGYHSASYFNDVFPQVKLIFVGKENVGAQISDLAIYPITSKIIRPNAQNQAFDILKSKFYGGRYGDVARYGLKIFP